MTDRLDLLTAAARERDALEAAAAASRDRLRRLVVEAVRDGARKAEVARAAGVSRVTVDQWLRE